MNDEVRIFGYCAECGNEIMDSHDNAYVDDDGNYFDTVECAMEYHKIRIVEF